MGIISHSFGFILVIHTAQTVADSIVHTKAMIGFNCIFNLLPKFFILILLL